MYHTYMKERGFLMKKKLTRTLAVVLIAMMLIPTLATLAVSAQGETNDISDIENVYKLNALDASPNTSSMDGEPEFEDGMLASKAFEITHASDGDRYIYVGPCPDPRTLSDKDYNNLIAYWYKSTGVAGGSPKKIGELKDNVIDEFPDGSVILKIKVGKIGGSYAKYAALKLPATYPNYILATCERPFNKDDYYAYADAQGWDIESVGLRPAIAQEAPEGHTGLWNLFPRLTDRDPLVRQHQNTTYVDSKYIPVTAGDVITMGAISTTELKKILTTFDEILAKIKTYSRSDIAVKLEEKLEYGFGIYSFIVPEGVSYIKVSVHSGIYNDGDILVTRNQPFTGDELRATLGIEGISDEAKAHPFYGKEALFVGDSISYGSYDTPPTYRNPSASWARRLALTTGLIPTNISYPGASVGKTGLSNVKWEYDLMSPALMSEKNYDMVVFHGGVNDARQNVAVGEALSSDTDRKVLVEEERLATFAGGLQIMFHDAKEKWPEADLYYVANFKLVTDSVRGKDMSEYFAQAKILCAEYGVQYIDLYNDVALYEVFDYESDSILPDLIHPISSAYDILFPTVLRLFNEAYENKGNDQPIVPENPTTPEETTPTEPEETTPAEPEETTPAPDDNVEEKEHVCEKVSGWKAFWNSIANFFRRLFGQPELCTCGEVIKKK